jgi:signal recognition particle GTPase
MNTKITDLSLEELKTFIDEAVDMRLEERLGDPDVGLSVKPEIIEKIRKSRRHRGTIPAAEVAKRISLKWS